MSRKVDRADFRRELEKRQGRLNVLHRKARDKDITTILVFEGWDAAGKGGAIRRVTAALDAPSYRVIPIAAPNDEERAHHYLWRFWRQLPRSGDLAIFDRSWYGRVLVERVEGFATPEAWRRAYSEINQFEEQLVDHGIVLVKYWLHITPSEQLRRFKERKALDVQAVEADRRGLAEPEEVGRVREGRERDGRPHQHAAGAVDARRGQR